VLLRIAARVEAASLLIRLLAERTVRVVRGEGGAAG
jgi:hypothetical protein